MSLMSYYGFDHPENMVVTKRKYFKIRFSCKMCIYYQTKILFWVVSTSFFHQHLTKTFLATLGSLNGHVMYFHHSQSPFVGEASNAQTFS